MPRLPRIQIEGAIYFVTSHGSHNQLIFKEKADYGMYEELLARYKNQYKFKLFSYCFLPDRLFLLIETGENLPSRQASASISQIMHDLTSLYTKYYNARYHRRGHLFESRFKSVLVEKAQYLLALTRHIHLAAKREMTPQEGVSLDPREYPFSSFQNYISLSSPRSLVGDQAGSPIRNFGDQNESDSRQKHAGMTRSLDMSKEIKEVLEFLKEKNNPAEYERYCIAGDKNEIEELEKRLHRSSVLGSDEFNDRVKNRIQERAQSQKEEVMAQGKTRQYKIAVVMVGVAVILATASSLYLYISKRQLENEYRSLLKEKEAEFIVKSRFENRSPLTLADLEGTEWEIELVSPTGVAKDKIRFVDGRFSSDFAEQKGFHTASYFLVPKGKGVSSWQSAQSNSSGDTMAWQAEWRGEAMRGDARLTVAGQSEQSFSFFSSNWSYKETEALTGGVK